MIDKLEEFGSLLRRNGLRVSTAELLDGVAAAEAVGLGDRERLRTALSTSLVKRAGDLPAFDELFELYFMRGTAFLDRASGAPLAEILDSLGLTGERLQAVAAILAASGMGMSAVARMGMGMRPPEITGLLQAAGLEVDLEGISSPLQIGHYAYRLLEQLDLRAAEGEISRALAQLVAAGELEDEEAASLQAAVGRNFERLRSAVREYVDQEFRRQNLDFMEQMAVKSLAERPLSQLSANDVARLRSEVARLARLLRARISLKPRLRKSGRLDLRRTLRRSLATGGVPFTIIRRHRVRRRPRLVILCDISDSVRNVSRFMLQFVYTLQELFDRVYSFAFVAELGELSELFRRHDLERAMELAYSGVAVNVFANSNYGRVLSAFAERHLDKVTTRTTVMVIGDGRNNYNPANAAILGDIRRRAKQLWWLNPEAPAAWGFGDSAMSEYRPHCDRLVVVYNLESLRKVVDELVM